MRWIHGLILLLLGCFSSVVTAKSEQDSAQTIRDALSRAFPKATVTDIQPAPLSGIYQVSVGGTLLYIDASAHYVFQGDLYDIKAKPTNLTETARQTNRKKLLATVPPKEIIRYGATQEKHVITVFTDIDCGYCRRFHQQIPSLNEKGVTVQYLAFPRSGPGTPSFEKMVSVWCSDDPKAALTRVKSGESLASKSCKNPVNKQFELGITMGVQGTPSLILEDGALVPGFATTDQLLELLQ